MQVSEEGTGRQTEGLAVKVLRVIRVAHSDEEVRLSSKPQTRSPRSSTLNPQFPHPGG